MEKRTFANTNILLSPIGLGTVKLGRNQGVKYPTSFSIPDDQSASNLIALAKDLGINLIDTAPAYGNSEERLGQLLAKQRSDWVICSKVGEEFENGQSFFDFSAKHTRMSVERSLQRLRTDYLDIVLIHSDGNDTDIIKNAEALQALARLKEQGLIRAYGISSKTVAGGLLAAQHTDIVMVTYNITQRDEEAVIDYCHKHNKGILVKKAFASGHLLTKPESADANQAHYTAQDNMDFIFSHSGISSVIVGTINPQHLKDNVKLVEQAINNNA